MNLITEQDFAELMNRSEQARLYYEGRWEYYRAVIDIIRNQPIRTALELGPARLPVVKDGDVMVHPEEDAWGRPESSPGTVYYHDATHLPWPVADRQYDLFIALQVWEHLAGKQREAFAEVRRAAKMAILSFPYRWDCPPDDRNYPEHHQIDERIIAEWTLGIEPAQIIHIPRTGSRVSKGPRIIYFWQF